MVCKNWRSMILISGLLAPLIFVPPLRANDFYSGKQVSIVVGFTPGGTYDLTARLFSRYIGKYLPGNPNVIVQNMPGAAGMVANQYVYNQAPKDGTVLSVLGGGTVIEPLIGQGQALYDGRHFTWIGGMTRDDFLCVVWHSVPIDNIEDVKSREISVGSTGPSSRTMTFPRALNELLGTKFKVVTGYPGGNEISLAMERGEVDGYCGWSINSIRSRAADWLNNRQFKVLAQFMLGTKGALPNVPIAHDLAPTEIGRQAIEMLEADSILAFPLVAPPNLPSERVAEIRSAFDAMNKDPAYLAEAKKLNLDVDPISGAEMQQVVDQLYATSPAVLDLVRKISAIQ